MFENPVVFSFPTHVLCGIGAVKSLPESLDAVGIKKPLLVTDPGLKSTESFTRVEGVLVGAGRPFAIFDGVHPNPIEEDVTKAVEVFTNEKCDGVIGLGGGSPLDVAKAVVVMAAHGGTLADYEAQFGGYEKIKGPLAPVITIPTTAGTGSEVGRSAVITVPSLGRKVVVFSPLLMPKRAILDPELTVGLPPHLTAATGMDALTHCIESLTSPEFQPLCDAIAVGGIEIIARYLERAFKNPTDLEARGYMLIAAMMGAVAFQKDLGAAHSLAHPLSTEFGVHHGLANALCLPHVMRFNKKHAATHYARIAAIFGVNTGDMDLLQAAGMGVDAVAALIQRLKLPMRLRDVNVPESALTTLAQKAFADSCHKTNPRPCTETDLLNMYRECW